MTVSESENQKKEKKPMKLGFNEATALECKGQSLLADMEMCEKWI